MARLEGRTPSRREVLGWAVGLATSHFVVPNLVSASPDDPIAALPAHAWANARQNGLIMIRHPAPDGLSSIARMTDAREPGSPLTVLGQVFAPDGRTPAAGVTVYAYNTDTDGYYGANRTEAPPRTYGWMITDRNGQFELHTIRPGRYPGMHIPAHIHFALWGGGYPPQWVDELRFAGDSYLTDTDLAADRARGRFQTIQPLAEQPDGSWRTTFAIRLAPHSNPNWQ